MGMADELKAVQTVAETEANWEAETGEADWSVEEWNKWTAELPESSTASKKNAQSSVTQTVVTPPAIPVNPEPMMQESQQSQEANLEFAATAGEGSIIVLGNGTQEQKPAEETALQIASQERQAQILSEVVGTRVLMDMQLIVGFDNKVYSVPEGATVIVIHSKRQPQTKQ